LRFSSARRMAARDYPHAISELRKAAEISQDSSQVLFLLGKAYAEAGDRAAAERVLADLQQRRRAGYVPATSVAQVMLALGDREGALDLLERGYEERDVRMSFLLLDWKSLRDEPRYQALLRRMALPAKPPSNG
ncbi:MAG: tetratricopeptide repeat protein, partial [Thermomonas sp.]